jgi:hypothetical protein
MALLVSSRAVNRASSAKFDALSYAFASATFNQSEAASKRRTTTHSIASYCPPF